MGIVSGAIINNVSLHTAARFSLFLAILYLIGYAIYQCHFHPLAKFPGPFLAKLTDLWQVHQFLTLKQPYNLTELHARYGEFVRYGPDKISVTCEDAISPLYQKGGKMFPKTEFYDAYGASHPNVFGMRDEGAHSMRRRHMSHSFSISSVKKMEIYLDNNIEILKRRIEEHVKLNQPFDLKKLLHYYTIDVLGELAFSQTFGVQEADDESLVPPVVAHSLLAAVTGAWPAMTVRLKRWLPKIPCNRLQQLFKGREACANLASKCVERRLAALHVEGDASEPQRSDILTSLITARHPDSGLTLTQTDLETEAFGFIIAGTHTTSATTSLLFYHLLHSPGVLAACTNEIDQNLSSLGTDRVAYSVTEVETSLPYLRRCIRENFRITPVFTMPLARRVESLEGLFVGGEHLPKGTSIAVCNHAFHHNAAVWGEDHMVFNPDRWNDPDTNARARFLMHFGLGGRQCIGKTIAQTNIYKLSSTLLDAYEFQLADPRERDAVARGEFRGVIPEMVSVGISDLKDTLMVTARRRARRAAVVK